MGLLEATDCWHNRDWHTWLSSNISSMRRSVSSPDETLSEKRVALKIRRAAEYFWRTSRCFIWWWNTVSNAWYYFSNKMISKEEIKDAKTSSFSSDFQTLLLSLRTKLANWNSLFSETISQQFTSKLKVCYLIFLTIKMRKVGADNSQF